MDRPCNIGILAIEAYFPNQFVDQAELEECDGVKPGKYTIGLGQKRMTFFLDNEDVVSAAMTVTHNLLDKYAVNPKSIGRLEVGTESSVDRSKSIKTFLMTLFEECGNSDIEGVDNVNACYGGTAGLYNAVNWIESSAWDGRYALVVATDEAVYAKGPARPSGGAGAVAFLVGPDAPLVLDRSLTSCHMEHAYDFYKPCGLYPKVDGPLSLKCYLQALQKCYIRLCHKAERCRTLGQVNPKHPHAPDNATPVQECCDPASAKIAGTAVPSGGDAETASAPTSSEASRHASQSLAFSAAAPHNDSLRTTASDTTGVLHGPHSISPHFGLNQLDYCCFHSPFHKLVRKAFAQLCHVDSLRQQRRQQSQCSTRHSHSAELDAHQQQQQQQPQVSSTNHDAHQQQQQQQSQVSGTSHDAHQQHQQQQQQQRPHDRQHQATALYKHQQAEADWLHQQLAPSLSDRALEKELAEASAAGFEAKVEPGCLAGKELGNAYSASLGLALASLVEAKGADLAGRTVLVYSYGSGLAAGMFVLRGRTGAGRFTLQHMQQKVLFERLRQRSKVSPECFEASMHQLEHAFQSADSTSMSSPSLLRPHTYYLTGVDREYRRFYARRD